MKSITRRKFIVAGLAPFLINTKTDGSVMTVNGPISPDQLGLSLIHEHFLVDFIGADRVDSNRWDKRVVVNKVLPYLQEVKRTGVKSIFDCTPVFLGRDVELLEMLADQSGIQIVTNTGYYGAVQNKYLPSWAFTETDDQLATRWINEFENGIDGTSVKPGFIKIGVDANVPLSDLHKKLVRAAATTHLNTGLTICSHTGPGATAFEEIEILRRCGVHPSAFVWVHAQAEKNRDFFSRATHQGFWVSLDGIGWGDFDNYVDSIIKLRGEGSLNRVLISHDAGWYKPDEPEAEFKGYMNIFTELIPRLERNGFSNESINQLLVQNPAEAFSIRIRKK